MKAIPIASCVLILCLMSGCYSVEQSMVERGYRWIRRGQTDKAVATFDGTIRKYPQSVMACTGLADALFEAERARDAIDAYSRAIALLESVRPESAKSGDAEVVGHRALSYQNQGLRFPFGLEAYLYLRRGGAYHALAKSASGLDADSFSKAVSDYDRALELSPGYTAAREARDRLKREARGPIQSTTDNSGASPLRV
jgi:tetratricopeptide (TPR) repeat protein